MHLGSFPVERNSSGHAPQKTQQAMQTEKNYTARRAAPLRQIKSAHEIEKPQ